MFEIVTDAYGKAGSSGSIYSYAKYDLELPASSLGFDMFISKNVLLLYPNYEWESMSDDFSRFFKKAIFHTRICHFREYKNEETGECEPCPKGSVSADGPFSKDCGGKKTGKQVPEKGNTEPSAIQNKILIGSIVGTLIFCILIVIGFACFLKKVMKNGNREG